MLCAEANCDRETIEGVYANLPGIFEVVIYLCKEHLRKFRLEQE